MSKNESSLTVAVRRLPRRLLPESDTPFNVQLPGDEVFTNQAFAARRLARSGVTIVLLFLGALIGWAYYAELSSAAIASGVVTVATNQRTVQHLEGGIVDEIYVREGDEVVAGQLLVSLRGSETRSRWEILVDRKFSVLALIDRLTAERAGSDRIEFREELLAEANRDKAIEAMQTQGDIFDTRRANWQTRNEILVQRIAQQEERIKGLNKQLSAEIEEQSLIRSELEGLTQLYEDRLIPLPTLTQVQREVVRIEGDIGQNQARIAEAREAISELRTSQLDQHEIRMREIAEELRVAIQEWQTVQDLLPAAEDALQRLAVASPIDGTVVGMSISTVGGVVAAGSPIMNIVPKNDELVVEARIDPSDIDVVRSGLSAQVRLTALSRRSAPSVNARVLWVSADGMTDPQSGQKYFLARLTFEDDLQQAFGDTIVNPGMVAEVIILTERSTTLDYIMEPIQRVLTRGMREG